MARDTTDLSPIETPDQLVEWLEKGCKPRDQWLIGTEHEKFGFYVADNSPVPYEGENGIRVLLERMGKALGWDPIHDDNRIIGLSHPQGQGAISLEPGGQFELSGAALDNLHQTCAESNAHLATVKQVAGDMNLAFIGLGASPLWTLAETPRMPKSRYAIMTRYMPKVGTKGLDMMYRTATIQTNLDFESEADMRRKLQLSLKLQPVAGALFARSPFTDGKPNGYLSWRSEIWRDTDNQRGGFHAFMLEPSFGFETYVDWALSVPMYFVIRDGRYHDCTDITFRQFMEGALRGRISDPEATVGDWSNHLTTLFPDVRLKRYLEMRGADGGPWRDICALSAFWVGLLYDPDSLAGAEEMTARWTPEMVGRMRDDVPKQALRAEIDGMKLAEIAARLLALSEQGLRARGHFNSEGQDETTYLEPLRETLASGLTPAERLLQRYATAWEGNVHRLFSEYAY